MPTILMPKLSDSMEEGTIVRWLVADGSDVTVGDELVEIETDKAVMTYEAEATGTLRISADDGDTVAVGAPIAHVQVPGEPLPAAPAPLRSSAAAVDRGAAAASGGATVIRPRPQANASPVARRLADRLGVHLASLTGTGPRGRIVKRDVEQATVALLPDGSVARGPAENGSAGAALPGLTGKGSVEVRQISRTQATIARRMSEAKSTMPEFTLTASVDMDAAVELRGRFKALDSAVLPSINDFVVRAAALALRAHPQVNGAFRDGQIELYDRVNVGVAVAAGDVLLVPTVMDADRRSLGEIAADTRRLAVKAREGTLSAAELSNGTFTVSNLGMFGITTFTAVLNPPQAAILAVGALERRPVVRDDDVLIAHSMSITLTCDHRILYGAAAAAFLADVRSLLEQPLRLAL